GRPRAPRRLYPGLYLQLERISVPPDPDELQREDRVRGDQQLLRGLQAAAVGTARRAGRGDDDAGHPVRPGLPRGARPGLHGRRRQGLSGAIATERESGMTQGSTVPVVREPERVLPVAHTPEVLVVGGGIAGIMAALAAGRSGARTLLVERFGSLGGTGTAAM